MRPLLSLIFVVFISGVGLAQTPTPPDNSGTNSGTPPAPASAPTPVKYPKAKGSKVSSLPPKTPPTAPETRDAKWEARAKGNIAAASSQAATIDLVFDGDSITDFWQKAGRNVWNSAFARKYHPFDFGIAGDTTQNVLWRLANGQAQGLHPKVILLMIGTNNMKYTSTPQDIADGVGAIIQQYQKVCPGAVIILQAIFPRNASPADPFRKKVEQTNPLLEKLADGTKVIYTNFGDKFLEPDGSISKDIMGDYLHPTEKGYQIWADAVSPLVAKYMQ